MHTHYYLQMVSCNATKNKLQHDVYEFFKRLDGLLIEKDELTALQERIVSEIYKINLKYPRMKPVEVHFSSFRTDGNLFVDTIEPLNFKIRTATLVLPELLPYFSPSLN